MRIRLSLCALLAAALMAGGLNGCDQQPGTTGGAGGGDPRNDGLLPHPLPEADPSILGSQQRGGGRTTTPPVAAPAPVAPTTAATGTATAPETGPGPETGATTAPVAAVAPKADFTTPKNAFKSLLAFTMAGDGEGMKTCFVAPATDEERALLEAGLAHRVSTPLLIVAAREKYPDQAAKDIAVYARAWERDNADSAASTEEIDGDKATVKLPTPEGADPPKPIKLVKVGDDWKLTIEDGSALRKPTDRQKDTDDVYASVTADIKTGKFATWDEAKSTLDSKIFEVAKKYLPGSSGPAPASAPATAPAASAPAAG